MKRIHYFGRLTAFLLFAMLIFAACGGGDGEGKGTGIDSTGADSDGDIPPDEMEKIGNIVNEADKEFPIETVHITFSHEGYEQGSSEMWIDGWGSTVVVKKALDKPFPDHHYLVWKDGKMTVWDPQGTEKLVNISSLRTIDTHGRRIRGKEAQLGSAGYVQGDDEEVAGKSCHVWKHKTMDVAVWRWNGIDLKHVNGALKNSKYTVMATAVEEGVKPPAEVFEYPSDFEVKDMTRGK